MPIFMDRHDISDGVTAESVAQLHQEDIKIQHQFCCRGLTYWFDDHRKKAFCLIEAPDAGSIKRMHDHAHGQIPTTIIEVDAAIVESFLGRIEDPENAGNTALNIISDPAFRIIMVISINNSLPEQVTHGEFKSLLREHKNAIVRLLDDYEGSLVKQNEKQFLASFKSVTNAVQAALEIQLLFKAIENDAAGEKDLVKIGLSGGAPVSEKNSIFEDTIKLAERMCRVVKGGMIVASEVKELYNNENANALGEGTDVFCLTQADEKFLTLLMDYLESAWCNTDLKVDDFSKPAGCSKSQLYRKLMQLTGKSPNTFIKEYRLDEALILLNKNNRNISEISFETGFNSPSYFSKCFQKRYNYLPSSYLPA